jgi:peptidyl-prolyl cis-trans isomerase C
MTKSLAVLLAVGSLATVRAQVESTSTNAAAPAKPGSQLFADTIVAKGKGVEVKRSQLDDKLVSVRATAAARGQTMPADMTLVERGVLDQTIGVQLVLAQATDADKAKGKEAALKRLESIRTNFPTEEAFTRQLKASGMTQESLRKEMTEELTAQEVLERELKSTFTTEELQKYYDDNPSKFEEPERVRASHILIGTTDMATGASLSDEKVAAKKKLAEDLLKRARAGEDFAKMAKEYSDDPGSKDKGGEYTFPRGQMVPEFESAAFGLKPGEVSDLVKTRYGFHIIKLSEKLPAKKESFTGADTKTIYTKRDGKTVTISDILNDQAMQKKVPEYIVKLRKAANVEILDEKLKGKPDEELSPTPSEPTRTPAPKTTK